MPSIDSASDSPRPGVDDTQQHAAQPKHTLLVPTANSQEYALSQSTGALASGPEEIVGTGGDVGADGEAGGDEEADKKSRCQWKRWIKPLIFLSVVVGLFLVFIFNGALVRRALDANQAFVQEHLVLAIFVLMFLYAVVVVILAPGSLLTLFIGFSFSQALGPVFGLLIGVLIVEIGATAGAVCAFLIGRYFLSSWVQGLVASRPTLQHLYEALKTRAAIGALLLRFSPLVPFSLLNYFLSILPISVFADFWTTLIGIFPGTFVYLYIGASAANLAELLSGNRSLSPLEISLFVIGLVVSVLLLVVSIVWGRRQLQRRLAEGDVEDPEAEIDGTPASGSTQALHAPLL